MTWAVGLNGELRRIAVKVGDKALHDLLAAEIGAQAASAQPLPQPYFLISHLPPQVLCHLQLFRGDRLPDNNPYLASLAPLHDKNSSPSRGGRGGPKGRGGS